MPKSVIVSQPRACDLCLAKGTEATAEYDARITKGPHRGSWANMCLGHWELVTDKQLGTGFGQRLIVKESPSESEPKTQCEECWPSTCTCV